MSPFESAFPIPDATYANGQVQYGTSGLSVRDYIAIQALSGLAANPNSWDSTNENIAVCAYGMADAMIIESQKLPQ